MKYSYIQPQKKSPLTKEVILVLTFFGVSLFMLFSVYGFLWYKNHTFTKEMAAIDKKRTELKSEIAKMKDRIAFIEEEANIANKIHTTNTVLKDSIANLFDLVPDRITLSKAQILKNGLILYGITPSKDVYEYMLEAPLRSIFAKNYTSFYQLENGWLHFVSTNYLDNEFEDMIHED